MTRILFVCHGNICRSPMAEFILKRLAEDAGLSDRLEIASAATSAEETGNPVYPPARRKLAEHGIGCAGKRARRLKPEDAKRYDLLIGMDRSNLREMRRICGESDRLRLLPEFAGRTDEIADPWYTGDFDAAWRDIDASCRGLLRALEAQEKTE